MISLKKNKFIKSTLILIIGGFISKIMAMVIRIILTRVIGTEGIGLYMLVLPTFVLFITLGNMGVTTSLSKLVSEHKKNNQKLVLSIIPTILLFNLLLMIILFVLAPFISNCLLHNKRIYYPIMAIGLTLPCITLSDLMRGYFFGKQKMLPYVVSNIIEQLVRLLLTSFFIPNLLKISLEIAITGVVLINIISEFTSIITLLFFIPKNAKIKKQDFKYNKECMHDVLRIGIPSTGTRLIGTISSFLEPITLTYALTLVGYSSKFITLEYGIINGYVLPLILLPSFFSYAISNALLPVVSNSYANNNITYAKAKIKQAIILSLLIGLPVTLIFIFIPNIPLKLIYHTDLGINYIKFLAPIFILHYIQSPLTTTLQAMNKAKCAMYGTLFGSIIRTSLLFICSIMKIGMWSLIIAIASNIIFVTIHHIYYVKKYLK